MGTRKSMRLPVILAFIIIGVIVYLFATIKQTEVKCEKVTTFDSNIYLKEEITSIMGNQRINSLNVKKTIILPEKYTKDETYLYKIKEELNRTLEYLGDKVTYKISNDRIIVEINVHKNEVVLLDNISFDITNDLKILINSNTKSSKVITLKVGDNYTDGEFMKRLKKKDYNCK